MRSEGNSVFSYEAGDGYYALKNEEKINLEQKFKGWHGEECIL